MILSLGGLLGDGGGERSVAFGDLRDAFEEVVEFEIGEVAVEFFGVDGAA